MESTTMLGRLRSRTANNTAPAQDEWYIPYRPTPDYTSSAGIGHIAPSAKPPTTLFSYFTSPTRSQSSNTKENPHPYPSSNHYDTHRQPPRPVNRRSSSYNTIADHPPYTRSIPASISVPTGLTAPKMLFSPISRQAHLQSFLPEVDVPQSGPSHPYPRPLPRQRTISAPDHVRRRKPSHPPGTRPEDRRWAVPTLCDLFVYPRPQIIPHTITPLDSPETEDVSVTEIGGERRVVQEGKARVKEREEWADLIKRRGRSLSFGNQSGGEDAPVIGNMRARSASRNNSIGRKDSTGSRMRSGSLSRRGSDSIPGFLRLDSGNSILTGRLGQGFGAGTGMDSRSNSMRKQKSSFEDMRRQQEVEYQKGHHHSRSTPEFTESTRGMRDRSTIPPVPRVAVPGPSTRTLRIQPPPEARRGGVIVIGADPHSNSTLRPRPTPLNLSKPLPDLPREAESEPIHLSPDQTPSSEIGIALTRQLESGPDIAIETTTITSNTPNPTSSIGQAHARAVLAKQHQRARTKRAFQTPTQGPTVYRARSTQSNPPSAISSTFPMHSDIEPAMAMLDISTSTSSSSTSLSGPRRQTALEEAIGRSRAASVGVAQARDITPQIIRSRPRTAESNDPALIPSLGPIHRISTPPQNNTDTPTFCPSPPLVYPIRTDRTPRPRPELQHLDSTASKATVYTDALEDFSDAETSSVMEVTPTPAFGRRELGVEDSPGDTPVTDKSFDDGDFHGLFFRSPHDRNGSFSTPRNTRPRLPIPRSVFALPDASSTPIGLGYAVASKSIPISHGSGGGSGGGSGSGTHRYSGESEGVSDETAEVSTPVINPHRSGGGQTRGPEFEEEQDVITFGNDGTRVSTLLAAFEDSPTMDEAEHSGSSGETAMPIVGPDVRFAEVPRHQPEYIATPGDSPGRPRSIVLVPEGESDASMASLPMASRPPESPSIFGIPASLIDHSSPPRGLGRGDRGTLLGV